MGPRSARRRRPWRARQVVTVGRRSRGRAGKRSDINRFFGALALHRRHPMAPLVTVVIPCYNQGHYLADALNSVAAQTYPHIETIVVDDGSTDHSAQVAAAAGVTVRPQR